MSNANDTIKVEVVDNYCKECKAGLDSENAILSVDLFRERRPSGNYLSFASGNTIQMIFDLSSSYEIKSIEVLGAKFVTIENLVLPKCSRQGNLVFYENQNYQIQGTWKRYAELEEYDEYKSKEYCFNPPVELTSSADKTILRIGIGTLPITQIIGASTNLFYALSENTLQEIWIKNPPLD
jgi:hypothetical protein